VVASHRTFPIAVDDAGARLDHWLTRKLPELGRKRARLWCEAGEVLVNGRAARKSRILQAGDEVSLPQPTARVAVANPKLTLDVRFENGHCVIVCKAAGQASVPLDGADHTTLVSALLAHYSSMQGVGDNPLEGGLIHRLDNGTSGLLVAARTQVAYDALKQALKNGRIEKEYVAVVLDRDLPEQGCIDAPLRPSPSNSRRVAVAGPNTRGARHATTRYHVVERSQGHAVVQAHAARALRHQVRAHFSSLGCPLVNDELYGGHPQAGLALGRHALHARRVVWEGTATIPAFDISAPLPEDLLALLRGLGFCEALSL
jgi:23S rRNA pseudouridine1911/1915/1917 synthase